MVRKNKVGIFIPFVTSLMYVNTKTNGSSWAPTPTTNKEVPTKFVGGGASTPRKIYTDHLTDKSEIEFF